MIANVFSKKSTDTTPYDLCKDVDVCDKVKEIYYKYQGECEKFLPSIFNADAKNRKYYVYAWYAKAEPKKFFYVGKGTAKRYNHILSDIEKYKNGEHNLRFQRYSEIQDKCGIDYVILLDNLTEYEALIYEECKKLEFLYNGEVLLNVEGIPDKYLPEGWYPQKNAISPALIKDPYYQRFLSDYNTPYFDVVVYENLMKTYLYPYFLDSDNLEVKKDKESIINWLIAHNAKIYKTISVKTRSVIIQGNLMYDRYLEYRNNKIQIYNSKDVIEFIEKYPNAALKK